MADGNSTISMSRAGSLANWVWIGVSTLRDESTLATLDDRERPRLLSFRRGRFSPPSVGNAIPWVWARDWLEGERGGRDRPRSPLVRPPPSTWSSSTLGFRVNSELKPPRLAEVDRRLLNFRFVRVPLSRSGEPGGSGRGGSVSVRLIAEVDWDSGDGPFLAPVEGPATERV